MLEPRSWNDVMRCYQDHLKPCTPSTSEGGSLCLAYIVDTIPDKISTHLAKASTFLAFNRTTTTDLRVWDIRSLPGVPIGTIAPCLLSIRVSDPLVRHYPVYMSSGPACVGTQNSDEDLIVCCLIGFRTIIIDHIMSFQYHKSVCMLLFTHDQLQMHDVRWRGSCIDHLLILKQDKL